MTIAFTRTDQTAARCHLPILLCRSLSFLECHVPCAAEKLSRSECWRSIYPLHLFLPGSNRSFFFAPRNIAQKERERKKRPSSVLFGRCGTGSSCAGSSTGRKEVSVWEQEREDGQTGGFPFRRESSGRACFLPRLQTSPKENIAQERATSRGSFLVPPSLAEFDV